MDFILGFTLGAITMALYAGARIRRLVTPSQPRYIIPANDYSRFRRTPDQAR
jgi:hypothetical protein